MVTRKEMTPFRHGLLWFGAAISIAEIVLATLLAPLGFKRALAAIVIGHAIGGAMMFLAGLIGARTRGGAMETVKIAFGARGGHFFSALNITQLVGWTAVMIAVGAAAANSVWQGVDPATFAIALGALTGLWVYVGKENIGGFNFVAVMALFGLSLLASRVVFGGAGGGSFGETALPVAGEMTFARAVELSAVMPLSWLPLISDYTRDAKSRPVRTTLVGVVAYSVASCWMYALGVGLALYAGGDGVALAMGKAGFGVAAIVIVVASTFTTTYLDVFSAGVSAASIDRRIPEKRAALVVCAVGTLVAVCFADTGKYESFLLFIGSVFAPMIAVQVTDFYVLGNRAVSAKPPCLPFIAWALGFAAYRLVMHFDVMTPLGISLPVIAFTALVYWLLRAAMTKKA